MENKWHKRFMEKAEQIADWSKDPNRKVGSVIVNDDKIIVSQGYNGPPRGCDDSIPERLIRPKKLLYFEHAERNALYHASRLGVSVNKCTMYASLFPCADCARGIIQSGIIRLVTTRPELGHHIWGESWTAALEMLNEAKVEIVWYNVNEE